MAADRSVQDVEFITKLVADKLKALEIRTIRQLAARMETDREPLRDYLELDQQSFEGLQSETEALIKSDFPEARRTWPQVNKRGVAVHRWQDRRRPRFHGDSD